MCPRVSLRCRLLPRPQRFPDATVSVCVPEAPAPRLLFACFPSQGGTGRLEGTGVGGSRFLRWAWLRTRPPSRSSLGRHCGKGSACSHPHDSAPTAGPFSDLLRTRPGFWRKRPGRCQGPPETVAPRNPSQSRGSTLSF